MILLLAAGVAGIFFGLYYQFLVLAPVTLGAGFTCSLTTLMLGQHAGSALLAFVLTAIGLQAGYMVGLFSRSYVASFSKRNSRVQSRRA